MALLWPNVPKLNHKCPKIKPTNRQFLPKSKHGQQLQRHELRRMGLEIFGKLPDDFVSILQTDHFMVRVGPRHNEKNESEVRRFIPQAPS